ncbi:MAG: SDR family oxidoreductase [Comamonadaceae bacterium]|nr:MAG: SDR family oxidoreductase [Comamonadaceae bacterium]
MTQLLEGRTAIITGASRARGIGLATAKMFAEHGARIAVLDLDLSDAQAAAAGLGTGHLGLACDVTDAAACHAAVAQAIRHFGHLDILVNNAGLTQKRGVMDVTADDYDLVTGVVLRGTLHMSQAVVPHMRGRKSGSIICMSSMSAEQGGGVFGGTHYCAAKAGVLGMARAMAKELGPDNVRVNAVCPGLVMTDFSRGGTTDERKNEMAQAFPLRRVGQPSDIAGACLYLASDLAAWVTGATIDVNGGAFMH